MKACAILGMLLVPGCKEVCADLSEGILASADLGFKSQPTHLDAVKPPPPFPCLSIEDNNSMSQGALNQACHCLPLHLTDPYSPLEPSSPLSLLLLPPLDPRTRSESCLSYNLNTSLNPGTKQVLINTC